MDEKKYRFTERYHFLRFCDTYVAKLFSTVMPEGLFVTVLTAGRALVCVELVQICFVLHLSFSDKQLFPVHISSINISYLIVFSNYICI